jgi:hypothetical protein
MWSLAASSPLSWSYFVSTPKRRVACPKAWPASKKSHEFSEASELDELNMAVCMDHDCDIDYLYSNILYVK